MPEVLPVAPPTDRQNQSVTPDAGPPLAYTANDLSTLLKCSKRHIAALNSSGRLPRPIRLGRSIRWRADEIREWLAAGAPSRDRWEARRNGGPK